MLQVINNTITIIIPVYNASKYITNCINSIKAQTFTDWKCIIVNDGSTDDSQSICEHLIKGDNRFILINQTNKGAGDARNLAIKVCDTRWLTFIDADDSVDSEYLNNFNCRILKDDEISVQGYKRVSCNGKFLGESKSFETKYFAKQEIADSFVSHKLLDYGQTVGKLYPTHLLRNNHIEFCTDFRLSEDHVFMLTALPFFNGIHFHSGMMYNYIEWNNGENLTSKKFYPEELWNRYLSLSKCYKSITTKFIINDIETKRWFEQFVYTGSFSLYIQSLRRSESNKLNYNIEKLKLYKDDFCEHFKPKSVRGKVMKIMILKLPIIILSSIIKFRLEQ